MLYWYMSCDVTNNKYAAVVSKIDLIITYFWAAYSTFHFVFCILKCLAIKNFNMFLQIHANKTCTNMFANTKGFLYTFDILLFTVA